MAEIVAGFDCVDETPYAYSEEELSRDAKWFPGRKKPWRLEAVVFSWEFHQAV